MEEHQETDHIPVEHCKMGIIALPHWSPSTLGIIREHRKLISGNLAIERPELPECTCGGSGGPKCINEHDAQRKCEQRCDHAEPDHNSACVNAMQWRTSRTRIRGQPMCGPRKVWQQIDRIWVHLERQGIIAEYRICKWLLHEWRGRVKDIYRFITKSAELETADANQQCP